MFVRLSVTFIKILLIWDKTTINHKILSAMHRMHTMLLWKMFRIWQYYFLRRLILKDISKHVTMMLVVVIQVVIVNVCVRPLLLMPGNVIDMASTSNGDHKNFAVSLYFWQSQIPLMWLFRHHEIQNTAIENRNGLSFEHRGHYDDKIFDKLPPHLSGSTSYKCLCK